MRRPTSASVLLSCPHPRAGGDALRALGLVLGGLLLLLGPAAPSRAAVLARTASGPRLARIGAAPRIPARATPLGAVNPATPLQVTIALTPRDPSALAAYAQAVATPGSGAYHHYLSVAQFAARFGAGASELAAVQSALRAEGLTASGPSANHLALTVTAPAGAAASAFDTSLERFRLPGGGRAMASLTAPAVPAGIAGLVQGVVGLSSLTTPTPTAVIRRRARAPIRMTRSGRLARLARGGSPAGARAPGEGAACPSAGDSGAYTAGQIASAYGFSGLYGTGDAGAGQTIALFELEPYDPADIAAYQSCYGTATSVTPVPVDGGAGSGSGSGEAALDIEDLIGLAPRASILVYEGPNTGSGAYDTYAQIISDDRAKIISTSWGACEDPSYASQLQAEASLFEEAAVQGQTVLAAAGDSGADDCQTGAGAAVDDPASQPDVTGVGGTTMTPTAAGPRESVWNSTWSGGAGAGGGGVSSIWPRPSYQAGSAIAQTATTCGSRQTACREVPDVTADADVNTGYAIYFQGGWYDFGGTSAATPTWAALIALTNAWSGCSTAVGFLNPKLYSAAQSDASTIFNDVTTGDNSFDGVTGYSAAAGYDMASGLGSPKGSALAGALCGSAAPPATATSSGGPTVSTAPAGGQTGTGTTSTPTGTGSGQTGTGTTTPTGSPTTGTSAPTATSAPPTTAPATSPVPEVTVTVAATVGGAVGRRLALHPRAVDSAGLALSWAATNLPAGLSIDPHSGAISGIPTHPGVAAVTVSATDADGGAGQATVRLVLAGRATVTRRITFPRPGRVQIAVRARAGQLSGGIHRLVLTVRGGLVHFASGRGWRRQLRLRGAAGRPLAALVARRGRSLIVRLAAPAAVVNLRLTAVVTPPRGGALATTAGARRPIALVTVTAA